MCAVSDLSESSNVSPKLLSASLGADGKRQAGALIYRLLLIKLIHFEMKHHSVRCKQKGIRGQS